MLNVNKHTRTKPKPKTTLIFKNCSYACAYYCVQVQVQRSYITQHGTFLIILPGCAHTTNEFVQMNSDPLVQMHSYEMSNYTYASADVY